MSAILDIVIPSLRALPAKQRTMDALVDALIPIIALYPAAEHDTVLAELCTAVCASGLVATSLEAMTDSDPELRELEAGKKLWGDVFCPPACELPLPLLVEDWDWEMPALNLRKDIWENFPVTVVPLGTGCDGAERHAVIWHRKNLTEWKQERPESYSDWLDYEEDQERRLFKALSASTKWIVEPAITEDQVCVLRMNFVAREEVAAAVPVVVALPGAAAAAAAAAPPRAPLARSPADAPAPVARAEAEGGWESVKPKAGSVPTLVRLNDIKTHFPVVWKQIPGTRINAIELHGKQMRDHGMNPAATKEALLRALHASTSWRVLRPETPAEVCRIELA